MLNKRPNTGQVSSEGSDFDFRLNDSVSVQFHIITYRRFLSTSSATVYTARGIISNLIHYLDTKWKRPGTFLLFKRLKAYLREGLLVVLIDIVYSSTTRRPNLYIPRTSFPRTPSSSNTSKRAPEHFRQRKYAPEETRGCTDTAS
jgi:hypothetical protein